MPLAFLFQDFANTSHSKILGQGIIDYNRRDLVENFPIDNCTNKLFCNGNSILWKWEFFEKDNLLVEYPVREYEARQYHHEQGLI